MTAKLPLIRFAADLLFANAKSFGYGAQAVGELSCSQVGKRRNAWYQ